MEAGAMNVEMERELETEIGRALQGLPDLAAPPGLLARTMQALEKPAAGQMRPWSAWRLSARIAFITVALAMVAAGVMALRAVEPGVLANLSHRLAPAASALEHSWSVLSALEGALALAVAHLGKGFMLAGLVAAAGAWAACAGVGTIVVRLALARPGRNPL
jgi:hypothetical protein